jgi:hypothetical protein
MTEQEKRPVLNGRPDYNSGPPVGLFHPVFNVFQAAMRKPFRGDAKTYSSVKALSRAFAAMYNLEQDRISEIDIHLPLLLGTSFLTVEAPGVKGDGVMTTPCGPAIAYVAIREVKNEIGMGNADPYNQASLAYRKYWAAESRKSH